MLLQVKAQALGLLATGTALATVLGFPWSSGWAVFRLAGDVFRYWYHCIVYYGCVDPLLPRLPSEHSGSLKSVPMLFQRPALVGMFALTVLAVTAHFTAYSYIEPLFERLHCKAKILLLYYY